MNRRRFLLAGGGTVAAVAAGTAAANATRADLLASSELTRGDGDPAAIERTIARESVEYVSSTNEVREHGHTQPFDEWARSECLERGANAVVSVVDDRLPGSVDGVGSGVRYLIFGPVVTVDHTVTRDRDGGVVSEPNVALDRLVAAAPGTLTVTVRLEGHEYATPVPVGVGHAELSLD